jgi:hypothetical protein
MKCTCQSGCFFDSFAKNNHTTHHPHRISSFFSFCRYDMFTSEDLPPRMGYAFGVNCDADPDVDGDDLERAKVVTQITMFRELLENTLLFLFDLRFISNLTHPHNLYCYHAPIHKKLPTTWSEHCRWNSINSNT